MAAKQIPASVAKARAITQRFVNELHGGYVKLPGISYGVFNDPALDRFRSAPKHRTPEAVALRALVAKTIREERKEYWGR